MSATTSAPVARPRVSESIRALSAAQKSNAGAPLYSRVINRPAGRVLAAVAHRVGMTPDQVTLLSACCTYLAVVLIAVWAPSVVAAVLTSLLLMVGYALDSADGQLARLRHGGSRAGEWLDHVADVIKLSTIHAAIAISLFRFSLDQLTGPVVLLVPLAFGAVQNVHFFSYILTYQCATTEARRWPRTRAGRASSRRCSRRRPTTASCASRSCCASRRPCSYASTGSC